MSQFPGLKPTNAAPSNERSKAFDSLKPPCIKLSRCILTTKPNNADLTTALTELSAVLEKIPTNQLNENIGEYVFFPLGYVLAQHRTVNDRSVELALLCLDVLLRYPWRMKLPGDLPKRLLILLGLILAHAPGESAKEKEKSLSEETKLAACICLRHYFGAVARSGDGVLEDANNVPMLGHLVTTLLDTFTEAEMLKLQLEALGAVESLLLDSVKDADIRASFYPGVVSALIKALGLGATTKRPFQVLERMVKVLDRLISSVLDDKACADLPEVDTRPEEEGKPPLKLLRTKSWVKATAANTKVALEQLLKLRTHSRREVRAGVFELSRNLLENCATTLEQATTILVETLVVISSDEDEALAGLALNTVRVMASVEEKIKTAVRECLDRWVVSLPRIMIGNDEDMKQRLTTRLSLVFTLCMELGLASDLMRDMLADGIKDSLLAMKPSKVATNPLVQATSAAPRLDILLADKPHLGTARQSASYPDVIVGRRTHRGTVESIKSFLSSLGRSADNSLVLAQSHLRNASIPSLPTEERAISFWLVINLLRGTLSATSELENFFDFDGPSLQQRISDELLSLALVNLTTPPEDEISATDSAPLTCLALEALSLVADSQKRGFRGELVDALYPVVHYMGSANLDVQTHAIITLNNLAHACEYSSARDLLLDNVDYLVNAVSLKLNVFDLSPQAPMVLNMLIKLVGPKLIPHLDDLVVSIFGILDGFHEHDRLCQALFTVLGSVVEESVTSDEAKQIEPSKPTKRELLSDEDLITFLRNRKEHKPVLEFQDESEPGTFPQKPWGDKHKSDTPDIPDPSDPSSILQEDDDNDEPPPPPDDDEDPPPSQTFAIVHRISNLSQHYLTHRTQHLRVQLLRLISNSTISLSHNTTQFLPLINDLWPVVFYRLFDSEPGVVIAAANAVGMIAETAGDFIAGRIEDGWDALKRAYKAAEKAGNKEVWQAVVGMLEKIVQFGGVSRGVADGVVRLVGGKVLAERRELRTALEGVVADSVWLEVERWRRGDWKGRVPESERWEFREIVF